MILFTWIFETAEEKVKAEFPNNFLFLSFQDNFTTNSINIYDKFRSFSLEWNEQLISLKHMIERMDFYFHWQRNQFEV